MTPVRLPQDAIDIAIIGAGIGGLAAAIALQRAGFDVEVFEQAGQMREVGGALVIRETSMALLGRWGVLDQLRSEMVAVNAVEVRDRQGKVLAITPTAVESGEGEFAYCVHRADIHNALATQLRPGRLHLGHRVSSVQNLAGHAEVSFDNGVCLKARLIVGADGLRSIVRTVLDATPMTFLNKIVHRTIAPASLLPPDLPNDRIRLWHSGDLVLNTLPIRRGDEVAISAAVPAQAAPEALWSSAPASEILSTYADFDPLIARLIEGRTAEITTHPVYDKAPLHRWADRHIVLLGDAAHPMAPMNGQGANQAIQDGDALAAALCGSHSDDWTLAITDYQSERAPVTARIQTSSRTPPPALMRVLERSS